MRAWAAIIVAALFLAPASDAAGRKPGHVRKPAVAGSFYPASRSALTAAVFGLLRQASRGAPSPQRPLALVVPHAGLAFSGAVAAVAYRQLRPGDVDRVVLVGPAHNASFPGYALESSRAFATPLGEVPVCPDSARLLAGDHARVTRDADVREHSLETQLPFLQVALGSFCLVPVLVGDTDEVAERAMASRLAALHDGRTLFVFSSDLMHWGARYQFTPFASRLTQARPRIRETEARIVSLLEAGDPLALRSFLEDSHANVCGRRGLATLLEMLRLLPQPAVLQRLATWASADLPGVKEESSVGYAALGAWPARREDVWARTAPPSPPDALPPPMDGATGQRLVRLARATLETELFGTNALLRELRELPEEDGLELGQAIFVTLTRRDAAEREAEGALRGCQGQVLPLLPPYLATVQAALEAALHDPRFPKLTPLEFQKVDVTVTALSLPEAVESHREIRLGQHGIILQKGNKSGLYLPDVPLQAAWSLETTLENLSRKAGLDRNGWKEGARLFVFTGVSFGEGAQPRR